MSAEIKKILVMGGGTGTYTVLSGLKKYAKDKKIELSAIITVSDSGGSTGRLRDEFGYLPVGDFRMALVSLSEGEREGALLRDLFLYRFDKGEGLSGHNFGNLFLVAMTDILGSEEKAIAFASKILRVSGKIIPVTTEDVTLVAKYEDDSVIKGEALIEEFPEDHNGDLRIKELFLEPEASISEGAKKAIEEADLIVLGPGDLYTSTLANIVVNGVPDALQKTSAKLALVINLMTKYGQTHGFSSSDFVAEIKRFVGKDPDVILKNTKILPMKIVEHYATQHEFPVDDDLENIPNVVRGDFLATEVIKQKSGDVVKRSLIRHDPDKLAEEIIKQL